MTIDKIYQEQLFKKLSQSLDFKRLRQLYQQLAERPIFWIVERLNINKVAHLDGNPVCISTKGAKSKTCLRCLRRALNKAKRSKGIEQFVCSAKNFGLCLPLVQGDALYGFLFLCHLKTAPHQAALRLLEALNSTILEKVQKELELNKLYQSIRPRAIALSTIHTIRRLISSTLNLDELLPRIARLSLQVLRAKQCVISLNDKNTKRLVPRAIIDLSKKDIKPRYPSTVRRIERKVLCTGNALLKRTFLCLPLIDEEPIGTITVIHKLTDKAFDNFDLEILTALGEQAIGAIRNAQLYKEQEEMLLGTVKALSSLLKVRSTYRHKHPQAFVEIVLGIAKELKLQEEDLRNLRFAAMLHDAGEIGIPEEILKKPAHLTKKEQRIIKEHPKKGVEILSPLQHLKPVVEIILHHHEKFDGTGYPDGLKREQIPLGSKIMAVADSFEAMISRRPYRKSTTITEAIKEIKRYGSKQFDPVVIKAFLAFTKEKSFRKLLKNDDHK